jgi:hypothetical protein
MIVYRPVNQFWWWKVLYGGSAVAVEGAAATGASSPDGPLVPAARPADLAASIWRRKEGKRICERRS